MISSKSEESDSKMGVLFDALRAFPESHVFSNSESSFYQGNAWTEDPMIVSTSLDIALGGWSQKDVFHALTLSVESGNVVYRIGRSGSLLQISVSGDDDYLERLSKKSQEYSISSCSLATGMLLLEFHLD